MGQLLGKRHVPYSTPNKEQHFPGILFSLLSLGPKSAEQLWTEQEYNMQRCLASKWRTALIFSQGTAAQHKLTFVRTEAVFAVFIKVVTGWAPQEAIIAALRCAAVVLGAHEQEGEFTELAVSVAKLHLHHCWKKKDNIDLFALRPIQSWRIQGIFKIGNFPGQYMGDLSWCQIYVFQVMLSKISVVVKWEIQEHVSAG